MLGLNGEALGSGKEESGAGIGVVGDSTKKTIFSYPMIKQTDMMEDMRTEVKKINHCNPRDSLKSIISLDFISKIKLFLAKAFQIFCFNIFSFLSFFPGSGLVRDRLREAHVQQ